MASPAVAIGGTAARQAALGSAIPLPAGGGQDSDGQKWAGAAVAALAALALLAMVPAVLITSVLGGGAGGGTISNPNALPAAAQPFVGMAQDAAHAYNVNAFL